MKNVFIKKSYVLLMVVVFLITLLASASAFAADKSISLNKYPSLKLGFTSQTLYKWLPLNVANVKTMLDFAQKEGFSFIEVRDTNASLSLNDAKEIAAYAKQKNIEVIYAMGVGALDDNYFEVFSRGLANAIAFDGPKIVRTAANGKEMKVDPQKQYWTAEEFNQLVKNLNQAGNIAKTFGMTLYVENGSEGLQGDGINTFGTADLFGPQGVNANIGLQLDMGNFFCVSHVDNAPNDVQNFLEANAKKIGYSHLKTSINHQPQPVLNGNELPFDVYFDLLAKNNKVYVAIENVSADTLENTYANYEKSIKYLQENF